jgi:hypothetical protein
LEFEIVLGIFLGAARFRHRPLPVGGLPDAMIARNSAIDCAICSPNAALREDLFMGPSIAEMLGQISVEVRKGL